MAKVISVNLRGLELQFGQPGVEAASGGQCRVRALFDNTPLIDHQNTVARQDRGQPVRDHDRGALRHQLGQRLLHQRFALGIQRRRRLIEQQQRRLAQDGARDGDALALAARQHDAAFADFASR